jgi:hypothetical protein
MKTKWNKWEREAKREAGGLMRRSDCFGPTATMQSTVQRMIDEHLLDLGANHCNVRDSSKILGLRPR